MDALAERLPDPIPYTSEGPQPLVRDPGEAAPFPVEVLGPLRDAVEAVQGLSLAPVAIPAASALAVAALAVQGFVDVETLAGPRPVSLYFMTIAPSGGRKSSCDGLLMQGLRDFEKAESRAHRDAQVAHRNRWALWKGEQARILTEARQGKGERHAAAEADLKALGREPAAPPAPDRTVTEPTFEGLTRKFAEGMPSLGILSDEGGQFLGGFAMSKEHRQKTLTGLNKAWQGDPLDRARQGEGSFKLFGRRRSMHLMAQPGGARDFMADPMAGDTGFLSRFLVCEPPSTIGTRQQAKVRPDRSGAVPAFAARLSAILARPLPMGPETRELTPRLLSLSPPARDALARFADEIEGAQVPGGPFDGLTAHACKAAEQAARIAGVLTAWDDPDAVDVSGATMADAIALVWFYLSEAVRLLRAAVVPEGIARAEALRRWLLNRWQHPEITLREVLQRAPIRGLREIGAARAALAILEGSGWIVRQPEGTVVRGAARREAFRIAGRTA